MKARASLAFILTALILCSVATQAQNARYYKWQGAQRVVCAQTSPGEGWVRLHGSYIKADCSL
jgi:hypothetical protein